MSSEIQHSLALLLISAASADGGIHPREEKIIRLGVGTEQYRIALAAYQGASREEREEMKGKVKMQLGERAAREKALALLKRIFMADGGYDPAESQWMREVWRELSG